MDIKGALYAVLGRRKIGIPSYQITEIRGNRQRFKCELRVPGVDYVGLGNSQGKKDAQTNAARDFATYMINQGMINASELPMLTVGSRK